MTIGQLRFRLSKAFPGVDADLLDGWIQDRYGEILAELPWTRLTKFATLQTVAQYTTGTVAVTLGSAAVTLTSGTWTTGMTGRRFRVLADSVFYTFTYVSGTTGTLERPYEGTTAAAATYSIAQAIYALPADCRMLDDNSFAPLERMDHSTMANSFPGRNTLGHPAFWADYMDDASSPPLIQIELYPVPDLAIGIPFSYTADGTTPTASSAAVAAWIEPATALVEGVTAKVKAYLKDYVGAQFHAGAAREALGTARNVESNRMGDSQMRLSSHFTSHRRRRWC